MSLLGGPCGCEFLPSFLEFRDHVGKLTCEGGVCMSVSGMHRGLAEARGCRRYPPHKVISNTALDLHAHIWAAADWACRLPAGDLSWARVTLLFQEKFISKLRVSGSFGCCWGNSLEGGPPHMEGNRETVEVVSLIVQALDGGSFKKELYWIIV